jgi:hypothetical protein
MAMQRPGVDPAGNDIYTLMLIVATVFVLIATIILAVKFGSYYGFENLFRGTAGVQ